MESNLNSSVHFALEPHRAPDGARHVKRRGAKFHGGGAVVRRTTGTSKTTRATSADNFDGQLDSETQTTSAIDARGSGSGQEFGSGHVKHVPQEQVAGTNGLSLAPTNEREAIREIVNLYPNRRAYQQAELSSHNQMRALCRRTVFADTLKERKELAKARLDRIVKGTMEPEDSSAYAACIPLLAGHRAAVEAKRAEEKRMAKFLRLIPVAEVALAIRGMGPNLVGGLVAETCPSHDSEGNFAADQDMASFKSVSAVWKRMGVGVFGGRRQRRTKDKDEAELMGFVARRRALVTQFGESLIGGMGRGPRLKPGQDIESADLTYYQKFFYARLRAFAAKDAEKHVKPVTDAGKESFSKHAWAHARTVTGKEFIKDFYLSWKAMRRGETDTRLARIAGLVPGALSANIAKPVLVPTTPTPSAVKAGRASSVGTEPREVAKRVGSSKKAATAAGSRATHVSKSEERARGSTNSVTAKAVRTRASLASDPRAAPPESTNSNPAEAGSRRAVLRSKPSMVTRVGSNSNAAKAVRRSASSGSASDKRSRSATPSKTRKTKKAA